VSLDGGVRRVVDGLADCDVPAVDELELGHGVGVARRHVVDNFVVVVVRRRASRRGCGVVVMVVRRVAMVYVQERRKWVRTMLAVGLHLRCR